MNELLMKTLFFVLWDLFCPRLQSVETWCWSFFFEKYLCHAFFENCFEMCYMCYDFTSFFWFCRGFGPPESHANGP